MNGDHRPAASGWFPDPLGRYDHRYFNGRSWTADVSDEGERRVDPLGVSSGHGASQPAASNAQGSTAALVCGIIAVAIAWMPLIVIAGIVLSVVALGLGRRGRAAGSGRSSAGFYLGIAGLAMSVVGLVFTVFAFREVDAFLTPERHDYTIGDCRVDDGIIEVRGSIVNTSNTSTAYTVFVTALDRATDDRQVINETGTFVDVIEIPTLDPDETADWQASFGAAGGADGCSAVADVYGPFPFGVPIDRP